jgi:PAS domain-containing protein
VPHDVSAFSLAQAVHNSEVLTSRHEKPASDIKDEAFRALFEHALDAVLIADDAGRYVAANAAAGLLLPMPNETICNRLGFWVDWEENTESIARCVPKILFGA